MGIQSLEELGYQPAIMDVAHGSDDQRVVCQITHEVPGHQGIRIKLNQVVKKSQNQHWTIAISSISLLLSTESAIIELSLITIDHHSTMGPSLQQKATIIIHHHSLNHHHLP